MKIYYSDDDELRSIRTMLHLSDEELKAHIEKGEICHIDNFLDNQKKYIEEVSKLPGHHPCKGDLGSVPL